MNGSDLDCKTTLYAHYVATVQIMLNYSKENFHYTVCQVIHDVEWEMCWCHWLG